jgi:hypothetical protein
MQKLKIKKTVQPDFKFISYSAWMKFITNRNNQKLTLKNK